ncbi:MAG: glycoside hydrolase family 28 protein, partial [bacterium]|nr:glycoside hydrolase family 28 protein [Candidatus Colisoma equi]
MKIKRYIAYLRVGLPALAVVSGSFFARAETVEIKDAPFKMPPITVPDFPNRNFTVTDFGAKDDGTKCTEAFAAAMAACEAAGGGRVVIPKGTWLTGAVRFRNNCSLCLEEGAVLEFTDDPADYPEVHTTWEGVECYNHSPLLFAYGFTNVAITGKGTIAPRMDFWRTWFARPPE